MTTTLILGATGLLGNALLKEASTRGVDAIGLARESSDIDLDIRDSLGLKRAICALNPSCIVNAAALVSIDDCEKRAGYAYEVNARPAAVLSEIAQENNTYVVQISTDHYYLNEKDRRHTENDQICLVNEYARTKYVAEIFTSIVENSLTIRTNIVGMLSSNKRKTFANWLVDALESDYQFTLFSDAYFSPISAEACAKVVFDLIDKRACGLVNVSARDVICKADFIRGVGTGLGISLEKAIVGSVKSLQTMRANSNGLDVSRAENLVGYRLPIVLDTIQHIVDTSDC